MWLCQDAVMAANYGLEGESYTMENGEPRYTELVMTQEENEEYARINADIHTNGTGPLLRRIITEMGTANIAPQCPSFRTENS